MLNFILGALTLYFVLGAIIGYGYVKNEYDEQDVISFWVDRYPDEPIKDWMHGLTKTIMFLDMFFLWGPYTTNEMLFERKEKE